MHTDGQNISLEGSNVVGSQYSMPADASPAYVLLARHSSTDIVLSVRELSHEA